MKRKVVDYTAQNVQDFLDYTVYDASHDDPNFADTDSILDAIGDTIRQHSVTALTAEEMENALGKLLVAGAISFDEIGVELAAQAMIVGFALGSCFPGWLERQRAQQSLEATPTIPGKGVAVRVRRKVVNQ
jgi:hypothetical protein